MLKRGDFEVAMDFQCGFIVEPDLDLPRFLSDSDANYGKSNDKVLDDLYVKQARATDPEERKKHLRAFEKRLLDEEVHTFMTLQWHRIVPHSSKVQGLDGHAEPLPQQHARHGVAQRIAQQNPLLGERPGGLSPRQ